MAGHLPREGGRFTLNREPHFYQPDFENRLPPTMGSEFNIDSLMQGHNMVKVILQHYLVIHLTKQELQYLKESSKEVHMYFESHLDCPLLPPKSLLSPHHRLPRSPWIMHPPFFFQWSQIRV